MNPQQRPEEVAPGGMRGSGRMHDPSEAEHDQQRRRLMNIAFLVLVGLTVAQCWRFRLHGWNYLQAFCLLLAGIPLGLAVKAFELRFKMAADERRRMLGELPRWRQRQFAIYAGLMVVAVSFNVWLIPWALWGMWGYDFVTYYHDRPERMRHLYAVAMTLDELRDFPMPWLWAVPAVSMAIWRSL